MDFTRSMRRFTIRTRMLGAVAALLLLLVLVGGIALAGMLRIQAASDRFIDTAFGASVNLARLRDALAGVSRAEQQLLSRYEMMEGLEGPTADWRKAVEQAQQQFGTLDAARREAAQQGFERYRGAMQAMLEKIRAGTMTPTAVPETIKPAHEALVQAGQALDALAAALQQEADAARVSQRELVRSTVIGFVATLVIAAAVVLPLSLLNAASISGPIEHARRVAERIATGDLTAGEADDGGHDEPAALLRALRHMQDSLRDLVGQVRASTASIGTASTEIAQGNMDLSTRTEQTASNLQQTASSMEQITGTVKQSADSARQADQLAASAAAVAERGGVVVQQVVSTMNEIHASSRRIADIIGTIDGIAFQTNILALNAAVEAARAGEQGRGFAVVAGEVRLLAQRSAEAAREIKGLIGSSVDRVETGSRLVGDAGQTMGEIVAAVRRVSGIVAEITASAGEQSSGIGSVNSALTELDRMTQQNAALVEQSAAAAESLRMQAERLAGVVGTFRVEATA